MWYFSWTPDIDAIDALRPDTDGPGEIARRGSAGKRRP